MNMHGTLKSPMGAAYDDESPRPLWKRLLPWVLVLLVAAAAAGWYFTQGSAEEKAAGAAGAGAAKDEAAKPRVTVIVPGMSLVASEVRATGSITARRSSPVGVTGEGGVVTAVLVKEGDFVRRGQVLVRIDRSVQMPQIAQMEAGIRQAQADAALAQAELERAQQLVQRGFISKADIDRKTATRDAARARVDVARAQATEMQARVARLDVRAPDNGLILTRSIEPGQVVGAGSPALFTLAQDGAMEMRAQVSEQELANVAVGQDATVRLVGGTESFTGKVWLIDPIIDPAARQGLVRIALGADRRLRPGAFAQAVIRTGETTRPILPQSAVLSDLDGNYVMVVGSDGKVARQSVTIGTVGGSGLVIAAGLTGRERVVESAAAFLNPGEAVTPVLKQAPRG